MRRLFPCLGFKGVFLGWLIFFVPVANAWNHRDAFYKFDSASVKPIVERISRFVPEEYRIPLQLLDQHDFVALSEEQVIKLLGAFPNTAVMLDKEIASSLANAEEHEAAMKNPFFAKHLPDMQRDAQLHREHAAYLAGLKGTLRPYLVKTRSCHDSVERGYRVDIDLQYHSLKVVSDCPGHGPVITHAVPIIVYVETDVQDVELDVMAYE